MLAQAALGCRRSGQPVRPPACLLAAGETTVNVRGTGTGGRNQELALAASRLLAGVPGILLTSFATDGIEGNSSAAGAYASGLTVAAGARAGRDPADCLQRNDAFSFLAAAGELIVTGPTGTNVNDLSFVLIE
jgi:glycerate 2-kinase